MDWPRAITASGGHAGRQTSALGLDMALSGPEPIALSGESAMVIFGSGCPERECIVTDNTAIMGWARTHERHLSALALAGGFAFDSMPLAASTGP